MPVKPSFPLHSIFEKYGKLSFLLLNFDSHSYYIPCLLSFGTLIIDHTLFGMLIWFCFTVLLVFLYHRFWGCGVIDVICSLWIFVAWNVQWAIHHLANFIMAKHSFKQQHPLGTLLFAVSYLGVVVLFSLIEFHKSYVVVNRKILFQKKNRKILYWCVKPNSYCLDILLKYFGLMDFRFFVFH